MKLRDFQTAAADSVMDELTRVQSTLCKCATGLGKTRIASEIIRRHSPLRTIFLADAEELVFQGMSQIEKATGLVSSVEMGTMRTNESYCGKSPVVVATIQSMNSGTVDWKRMHKFKPNDFGLCICDEAHKFVAKSFQKVINYFKQNPNIKIVGLTATADRLDQVALGEVFQSVACDYDLHWGVENGWLVMPHQKFASIAGLDYSHIKTTCGDLNGAQLAAVLEQEETVQRSIMAIFETANQLEENSLNDVPVEQWSDIAAAFGTPMKTIIYGTSVKQSEMYAEILNRIEAGLARHVDGKTAKDKRRLTVKDFSEGRFQFLCNVGCFTTGFDSPNTKLIVVARPTKSRMLYTQIIGRGTRTVANVDLYSTAEERKAAIAASEKPFLTVLDLVGNSGRHKLVSMLDILGGKSSAEVLARASKRLKKEGKAVNVKQLLEEEEEALRKEIEEANAREAAKRARLVARAKYSTRTVNPFDVFDIQPTQYNGKNGKTLSEKQVSFLLKQGVNPNGMNYYQAKQLLNEMFRRFNNRLATLKQCSILQKRGIATKDLTAEQASKLIDEIAVKEGWGTRK